jgi:lipocalin-like protein
MRRMALVVAALLLLAVSLRVPAQQPAQFSPLDLVGTWTLDSAEPGDGAPARGRGDGAPAAGRGDGAATGRGARGDGAPATGRGGGGRGANLKGLLIFDRAGHAFEMITRATMQQPAGAQPPLTDQQLRFAMSGGFWGSYKVDAQKKTMTFQTEGAFSPNMMGRELTRSFDLAGDRLTVTYGGSEHYAPSGTKWTFERVPTADNAMAPTYRKVIGFWQHVVEKRVNLTTGATLSETRRAPSIIVYTPSGYVGVHFPGLNRQKFAADLPTDAEARGAFSGYVGYFGALSVYPNMVFHQILGGVSMTPGTTLKRPLEMSGDDDVTIKFPVNPNQQGQQTTTWVMLHRLSGEKDMIR